jgi:hypothetical protein
LKVVSIPQKHQLWKPDLGFIVYSRGDELWGDHWQGSADAASQYRKHSMGVDPLELMRSSL